MIEWDNKGNQKIPGSLPSQGNLFLKKERKKTTTRCSVSADPGSIPARVYIHERFFREIMSMLQSPKIATKTMVFKIILSKKWRPVI
jgi:hypothetical protein